jgi:hypothetical protein
MSKYFSGPQRRSCMTLNEEPDSSVRRSSLAPVTQSRRRRMNLPRLRCIHLSFMTLCEPQLPVPIPRPSCIRYFHVPFSQDPGYMTRHKLARARGSAAANGALAERTQRNATSAPLKDIVLGLVLAPRAWLFGAWSDFNSKGQGLRRQESVRAVRELHPVGRR